MRSRSRSDFTRTCTPPGDVPRAEWQVELGAAERLVLDERMIPTGRPSPWRSASFALADSSWDDGLVGLTLPPVFARRAGGQTLTVTFDEGFGWAQVYAPPRARTSSASSR